MREVDGATEVAGRPATPIRSDHEARIDWDSRARTHLANERTFLAWLRAGITLITLGLGAAQILTRNLAPGVPLVEAMSIVLIALGILTTIAGAVEYFQNRTAIEGGRIRSIRPVIVIVTGAIALLGAAAIFFVILLHRVPSG